MRTLLVIWFHLLLSAVVAQQSPYYIKNYTTADDKPIAQMWQGVQDKRGIIHIAATSHVYHYNGTNWSWTTVKFGSANRQISYDEKNDRLYVSSVSDFGYLDRNAFGAYQFVSFLPQLTDSQKVFLDVWKIYREGEYVYFQSAERIFVVQGTQVVKVIEPHQGHSFALMFQCNGLLFVRERGVGLVRVSINGLQTISGTDFFATERLLGALPAGKDSILLLTGDFGWKMMHLTGRSAQVTHYAIPNEQELINFGVLGCEYINSEEYAVVSRTGVHIYNKQHQLLHSFNKVAGMTDESIGEIFVDREGNIWAFHNNGCSRVSYHGPVQSFGENFGFSGTAECLIVNRDTAYLGTFEGFYMCTPFSKLGRGARFEPTPIQMQEVWHVSATNNGALVGSAFGTWWYKPGRTISVTTTYTNFITLYPDSIHALAGERGGISVLSFTDNKWSQLTHFNLPGKEIIRLSAVRSTVDNRYEVWATTREKHLLKITYDHKEVYEVREYDENNGVSLVDLYPVLVNDTLYFFNYYTAFRYKSAKDINKNSACFEEAPDMFTRLYLQPGIEISPPLDHRLFLDRIKEQRTVFYGLHNGRIIRNTATLGNIFQGSYIQHGFVTPDNYVYILSSHSIFRFDKSKPFNTQLRYSTVISEVKFSGDSMPYILPEKLFPREISFASNSVRFKFAAPYHAYEMMPQFSYQLTGYDTGWTVFSKAHEKEYTNLPEGTYTFKVKAMNPLNMESETAEFTFTILPPWYRTGWAYTGYVVLLILLIWIAIKIATYRINRQKLKLEGIVAERTEEIEIKKQELEEALLDLNDSINYAQRIQQAMLPKRNELNNYFEDAFILFQPRNVVSGDFYWLAEHNQMIYVACADCTGHGVPGALMSMIGSTLLTQIVKEKGLIHPDEILHALHDGVRAALKQDSGNETRDGMDIALCVIDKEKHLLHYSGANRPLWMVRNGEFVEYKANKFPIAGELHKEGQRYVAHTISLQQDDAIYLSSDGYADQFGGEKGKKYMIKRLHGKLTEVAGLAMRVQAAILQEEFENWKGTQEQVDDVLVMGFRYSG